MSDSLVNQPANLTSATKIDLLFCGADGSGVVVDVMPAESASIGFLKIEILAEKSKLFDVQNGDFDLRLYNGEKITAVCPFRGALVFIAPVCLV